MYKLIRLESETNFQTAAQVRDHLSLVSKYRNNLKGFAVFRNTTKEGWVCWYDPSDLQRLVDGEICIDWDDFFFEEEEEED